MRPYTITGVDIGSSKISAVTAEIDKAGVFNVVAHITNPSKGVSRGVFTDLNAAIDSVTKVLVKLRDKIGNRPSNIYVSISGQGVTGWKSRGMVPLSLRGREVTKGDIDRCINAASTINLPYDREIIHKIAHNFSIDDQSCIKNPLGLFASRLNCELYIITANVNHIQNIYKCVTSAGYDVKEVVFSGIADGASLLDEEEKDSGVILLDMGASLTEVTIFFEGKLNDLEIIPIGAEDMNGDLNNDSNALRLIASLNSKLQNFLSSKGKITSVVLTGGLVFSDGVVEFLEEKLQYPVKMGMVTDVRGDISSLDSLRLATAIGLCKYAYEKNKKKTQEEGGLAKRLSTKVVDIFNNYF